MGCGRGVASSRSLVARQWSWDSVPPRAASADCAPRSKLVPIRATIIITAAPAATTRLGRGGG